jgi:hypothetical protein
VDVTLGAGDYEVTEEAPLVTFPGAGIFLNINFAGDCTKDPNQPALATGTIEAGESQICDISNDYITFSLPQP